MERQFNAVLQARATAAAAEKFGMEHVAVYDEEVMERCFSPDHIDDELSVEPQDELDNTTSVFFGSRFDGEYSDSEPVCLTDKGRIVTVAHYNGDVDYPYTSSIEELVDPDPKLKLAYEDLLGEPKVLDI